MLTIKHLKAHLPSKNCQLKFVLRPREPLLKQTSMQLTEEYVDMDLDYRILLVPHPLDKPMEICVIAVLGEGEVNVGVAHARIGRTGDEEARLEGVAQQNGYILYSVAREDRFKNRTSFQRPAQISSLKMSIDKKAPTNSKGFIKYKNSSSSSSYSENQASFQSRSGSQSPFRKNKDPLNLQQQTQDYHKMLDELYHQVLEEHLFNQKAWNKIHDNQIFQIRHRDRLRYLLQEQ